MLDGASPFQATRRDNPMPAQVAYRQNFPIYSIETKQTAAMRLLCQGYLPVLVHKHQTTKVYGKVEVNLRILKPRC
jgi:hypothetical protein